jgi:AAA15 family ATPase/GTPase
MELENFKAFGETNRIEFAPITLTFGEKSASKSSILQALNLLIQTRQSRDHGASCYYQGPKVGLSNWGKRTDTSIGFTEAKAC